MGKIPVVTAFCAILCLAVPGCRNSGDTSANSESTSGETSGETSGGGVSSVGEWASDSWNGALSTGSRTVENTGQWLTNLYESARDAGTTSARSVTEWAAEDWNARGDWEYRILELARDDAELVESTLNEAGKARWECYHVDPAGENWTFFLKRSKRSYLSKIPLRDVANILPGLTGGEGE